jgi:hypothetical protein
MKKPWRRKKRSKQLQLEVMHLPDISMNMDSAEAVLLVVSVKILKKRLPGYNYSSHTTITLSAGAKVFTDTPEEKHCFKESKDDVNFTMVVATQEAVEKSDCSELKLSVEVQVHERMRGDVSFTENSEDGFTMVDWLNED